MIKLCLLQTSAVVLCISHEVFEVHVFEVHLEDQADLKAVINLKIPEVDTNLECPHMIMFNFTVLVPRMEILHYTC